MSVYAHSSETSEHVGDILTRLMRNKGLRDVDTCSLPETHVTLEFPARGVHEAQLSGSQDVICTSPAEFKANKLNRSEQTKLENFSYRVTKEMELSKRRFIQYERSIRAKSAKIMDRIKKIEASSHEDVRPMTFTYGKTFVREPSSIRPHSYPAMKPVSQNHAQEKCVLCEKIQRIINMYESEGKRAGILNDTSDHSTCMFSDQQVREFLQMLEAKYLEEVPHLNRKLRDKGLLPKNKSSALTKGSKSSKEHVTNSIDQRNVEVKIKTFCVELDMYKKQNPSIPQQVRDLVERSRLENAVSTRRPPPRPPSSKSIVKEARRMLQLT